MEINVREQFLDMSWKSGDTLAVLTPHGGGPYTAEEIRLLSVALEKMAEIMEDDLYSREYALRASVINAAMLYGETKDTDE